MWDGIGRIIVVCMLLGCMWKVGYGVVLIVSWFSSKSWSPIVWSMVIGVKDQASKMVSRLGLRIW